MADSSADASRLAHEAVVEHRKALEQSRTPSDSTASLEAEILARHLLVDYMRGWQELESFRVRRLLRNHCSSEMVRQAFDMLKENGIVEKETRAQNRGRALVVIKKRSWSEIDSDPSDAPRSFLKRLRVNRDSFE